MNFPALVERYIGVWNLGDGERSAAMNQVFTADVLYADPIVSLTGREALDRYIGMTQRQFRGNFSAVPGQVDGHHGQVRFGWVCAKPGGEPLISGFDVALFEDEQVRALYGFFERSGR